MTMTINYSNPRLSAIIENWPNGKHRVTAKFAIEANAKGERAIRTTTGKPKILTYARRARIIDGDDGRTYIAEDNGSHFTIMQGNMQFQQETVFPNNPRFAAVAALFN